MEDRTKEMALRVMQNASSGMEKQDKIPVRLCEDPAKTAALLLGNYGAIVENRDVPFLMDDATVSKVDKVVKWMYESRKRGLLLCGTLGNGKTTMLRSIARVISTYAYYFDAQALYDHFRQFQKFPDIPPKAILLIDDLGTEPSTYNDFGEIRYPLTELLLKRYKFNQTTIIATNLTFEQIGETYGDRVKDRMREMYAQISYQEPSYRR